jgi:hypothetical protein
LFCALQKAFIPRDQQTKGTKVQKYFTKERNIKMKYIMAKKKKKENIL